MSNYYDRMLILSLIILTLLEVMLLLSLPLSSKWFNEISAYFMIVCNTFILGCFVWIYVLFVILLRRPDLHFLKFQVHFFFLVVIAMSLGRIIATITENVIDAKYQQIEYFNIATECLFNVFILYCLVTIQSK